MSEFQRKCYGDIEIKMNDRIYEVKTETDNVMRLNHIACQQ